MSASYHSKIQVTQEAVRNADSILIGGGAGLSSSAGLTYDGERFSSHFSDFIRRYGLTDMYSAGFYPFPSQVEKWAYWSRHIKVNRYDPGPGKVYNDLLNLVQDKSYFVLTTNADKQFAKTGFENDRVFAIQGDYGKFQCAVACHKVLYSNEEAILQMATDQQDCRIPSHLIPKCPRCGGAMEPNIRKDRFFVEDGEWHQARSNYVEYVSDLDNKRIVLLELGVGYNTPAIIKIPFERITTKAANATLVRVNRDYPEVSPVNQAKTISFSKDIGEIIAALRQKRESLELSLTDSLSGVRH